MKIGALARLGAFCLSMLVPSAALACSCVWSSEDAADARLKAAAASVEYIAVGEIVGETEQPSPGGTALYRTLRVEEAIKGEIPAIIEVQVGAPTPSPEGPVLIVNSCDVRPKLGSRGVWALRRIHEEWKFAGVCATDAVRSIVAAGRESEGPGDDADAACRDRQASPGPRE